MSRIAEELADQLARDTIAAAEKLGDDRLIEQIATAIGASSPTTEELFRTLVRVRIAEARAQVAGTKNRRRQRAARLSQHS